MKVLYDVYICCSNIYGNRLSDVYLYGSYALGDYDNESDVDILVTANIDTPEHGDYFNKISNDNPNVGPGSYFLNRNTIINNRNKIRITKC